MFTVFIKLQEFHIHFNSLTVSKRLLLFCSKKCTCECELTRLANQRTLPGHVTFAVRHQHDSWSLQQGVFIDLHDGRVPTCELTDQQRYKQPLACLFGDVTHFRNSLTRRFKVRLHRPTDRGTLPSAGPLQNINTKYRAF